MPAENRHYPVITEADVRARAGRSFARGKDYYQRGSIRQLTVQGWTLTALCEGSQYESLPRAS